MHQSHSRAVLRLRTSSWRTGWSTASTMPSHHTSAPPGAVRSSWGRLRRLHADALLCSARWCSCDQHPLSPSTEHTANFSVRVFDRNGEHFMCNQCSKRECVEDHLPNGRRFAVWPRVREFIESLPSGAVVADVGCGNGKYFGVRRDIAVLGSDRSCGLAHVAAQRLVPGCAAGALQGL